MESALSIYLYLGPRDQSQDSRIVKQVPLPAELSGQFSKRNFQPLSLRLNLSLVRGYCLSGGGNTANSTSLKYS